MSVLCFVHCLVYLDGFRSSFECMVNEDIAIWVDSSDLLMGDVMIAILGQFLEHFAELKSLNVVLLVGRFLREFQLNSSILGALGHELVLRSAFVLAEIVGVCFLKEKLKNLRQVGKKLVSNCSIGAESFCSCNNSFDAP
ncbi:hypothetical protein YC2023_120070 [Brassica napus]|uniref:(rape) hypothetical protein n=1 Tax=Brassica napus TaxID=3708 RepID=A0A816J8Y4_BRANA|nr:unnamed protein product [Brassica napus]